MVGSWTSPEQHDFFANGNVLAWSGLLKFKNEHNALPDNFGIDWVSGVYGSETIAHVIGAWQTYQHSGNQTFLALAYDFYKDLFWDGIYGKVWFYAYDSVLCLNKMAEVLGHAEDAAHWNTTVGMEHLNQSLWNQWQMDTPNIFGSTQNGVRWTSFANAGLSMFPREWAEAMAVNWLNDPVDGFLTDVPFPRIALKDLPDQADSLGNFGIVPDGNWFMIRGLYQHNIDGLANKFTLAHLKKYNLELGVPVAPEARRLDFSLFGDQYSNFNAGKILLVLEGIGGLSYSVHEDTFTFADNLPEEWTFMEFRVPVKRPHQGTVWVTARAERTMEQGKMVKAVTVRNNPFTKLTLEPWTEAREVEAAKPHEAAGVGSEGHLSWTFNSENASVAFTWKEN